jgi:hypothetical protein
MSKSDFVTREQQCLDAANRSRDWLLSMQNPDGSWKPLKTQPVDAFYKVGAMFNLMGETLAAERVFDYVKAHLLQPDGDFGPRENPWHVHVHYQYANGWLVLGAQRQGRFDIAAPALRFLLTQQDPDHGGFYSEKSVGGKKQRSDTMSSGISGIALLAAGQMDAARKLAAHFEKIIAMQPAPAERFYLTLNADGKLGVSFPEDETFWRVIDTQKKDQCWYAVGLPFTFGLLMYQATGEERYLKLAQWFFDFQRRCANPWDGGSSGKAAWACAIRYREHGDPQDRDIALQVARLYLDMQTLDGWYASRDKAGYAGKSAAGANLEFGPGEFDGIAELTLWLRLIGANLLARDGR